MKRKRDERKLGGIEHPLECWPLITEAAHRALTELDQICQKRTGRAFPSSTRELLRLILRDLRNRPEMFFNDQRRELDRLVGSPDFEYIAVILALIAMEDLDPNLQDHLRVGIFERWPQIRTATERWSDINSKAPPPVEEAEARERGAEHLRKMWRIESKRMRRRNELLAAAAPFDDEALRQALAADDLETAAARLDMLQRQKREAEASATRVDETQILRQKRYDTLEARWLATPPTKTRAPETELDALRRLITNGKDREFRLVAYRIEKAFG